MNTEQTNKTIFTYNVKPCALFKDIDVQSYQKRNCKNVRNVFLVNI